MRTRAVVAGAALAALLAGGPASGDDLADVRRERAQLQRHLDDAAERLAAVESRVGALDAEQESLAAQLAALEGDIAAADERVSDRVRTMFKRGGVDPVLAALTGADVDDALERATVVVGLVRDDRAASESAAAKRTTAEALAARLAQRQADLEQALVEQRAAAEQLRADLERAQALEQRLEEEARAREEAAQRARAAATRASASRSLRRAVPPPSASPAVTGPVPAGGMACPVGRPRSFTDTWGAPRSGGRRHRGTDILAPHGTPIYAITSGVVDRRGYGSSAGYWLILRGSNGDHYWYLHLQGYTVADGARVSAGTQIGTNGDTGNARGTPHLHFERHRGGAGAINPYPLLRRVCG